MKKLKNSRNLRWILLSWVSLLFIFVVSHLDFPHSEITLATFLNRTIQSLLFCICFSILLNEPAKSNKFIFLNFVLSFSFFVIQFLFNEFVGVSIFDQYKYSHFFFNHYSIIGFDLFLSLALLYLLVDFVYCPLKPIYN